MTFSRQILVGLLLGIATGVFFGERVAFVQVVADAYVKLLQMTVLPYVTVSLIGGLGRLDMEQARALGLRAGVVLLVLWAIAIAGVFLFPLTFPDIETASFFSTTLLEEREPFDFVSLYIPANPFYSLANNVVPAVVLFSVVLGVALIGVPAKQRLLDVLDVATAVMSRANGLIARLMPLGLFAIAAAAAGTLEIEQIERLQVYLIGYVAVALLLSLWILPGLVAAITPVSYREMLSAMHDALLTAFITSNLFIVLPMIVAESQTLLRRHGLQDARHGSLPDVIVPASFNFPHVGKLLTLSFILFAGWFADAAVPVEEYPRLTAAGVLVLFGNINAAVPFLLDLFRIPADTFQLFLATSVVNARFGTLIAATHTVAMALIGSWAVAGRLHLDARRLTRYVVMSLLLTAATVAAARAICLAVVSPDYDRDRVLMSMRLKGAPARMGEAPPQAAEAAPGPAIVRVRRTGVLQVCWPPDALPFAFQNDRGELVGLDVELAQDLATVLGASATFVRAERDDFVAYLTEGRCDIAVGGIAATADRARDLRLSTSYLDETLAFMVPDNLRQAYGTWDHIRRRGSVVIAVPPLRQFEVKLREALPDARFVPVRSAEAIFKDLGAGVEAVALTAERGSAWTLLHPQYSVAIPRPGLVKVPLAFAMAPDDAAFVGLVDTWIELRTKDGTIADQYGRWILGRVDVARRPRWSVMGDVLHWGR